jgi:hypothetical protein
MGILDDAIREHLELRRRHGAREDELRRLEDEAFGPPARPGEEGSPTPAEEGPGDEAEAPPEPFDAYSSEMSETEAEDADLDIGDLDLDLDEEPAEPPIENLETAEHPGPIEAQDTVEHSIEEEIGEEPPARSDAAPATEEEDELVEGEEVVPDEETAQGEPGSEEDVLEETPEFLRDQPEDDELWFEQGEPKDFDF